MINGTIESKTQTNQNTENRIQVITGMVKIAPPSELYIRPKDFDVDIDTVKTILSSEILCGFERFFRCNNKSFAAKLLNGKVSTGFQPTKEVINIRTSLYRTIQKDFPGIIFRVGKLRQDLSMQCSVINKKTGKKTKLVLHPTSQGYSEEIKKQSGEVIEPIKKLIENILAKGGKK